MKLKELGEKTTSDLSDKKQLQIKQPVTITGA